MKDCLETKPWLKPQFVSAALVLLGVCVAAAHLLPDMTLGLLLFVVSAAAVAQWMARRESQKEGTARL